jgi:uncharacterized membrane protein
MWDRRRLTAKGTHTRGGANAHGWVMLLFGATGMIDIMVRRLGYAEAGHTPAVVLIITLGLFALAVAGGTLGGELVFDEGLGVEGARSERHHPDAAQLE